VPLEAELNGSWHNTKPTPSSGEVQGADNDERGSANTTGEEVVGRRKTSTQGGVGPPEQPARLQRPHAPARPDSLAWQREPDPITSPSRQCAGGSNGSIRESRGAARTGKVGYARPPYRTEPNPLRLFRCIETKKKNLTVIYSLPLNLFVVP
jgi:hypothetical protein